MLAEAREWLGTPYRHMGRVKGRDGGCDCLTLLAEVYARAGIVPRVEIPFYAPDWHLHRSDERYMAGLLRYCWPVSAPEPADIALFRFGRAYAHGTIVTQWPKLIHAWNRTGVVESDATQPTLAGRPVLFFSPFAEGPQQ